MVRFFLFVLFAITSNNATAFVQGKTLICDKDRRGYNFISKDKVEVLSINFEQLNVISINHSYKLTENAIFIQQPQMEFHKENITKPIGWIFRRTLDYVSLYQVNGDWNRKFLWSCEIISSDQLKQRLQNKIYHLIKVGKNKRKDFN